MVYQVHLSREDLQQKFSKLRKLKYNQFRWWRMYDDPKPKLHPRSPLRDRIMNGDFDYPHYKYQAMWVEHDINDMRELYKNDSGRYVEESSLLRTRRKRLMEDFEKEENEKLESLVTEFARNFKCSVEQARKEMEEFDGTLLELYFHIEEKYKITHMPYPGKRRGRPAKNLATA